MTIILDTSLILALFDARKLDVLSLREISGDGRVEIPHSVAFELKKLGKGAILEYLLKNGCSILPGRARYADREIAEIVRSAEGNLTIGTQDFALVAKLKAFKGKFRHLFLKGKKRLSFSLNKG